MNKNWSRVFPQSDYILLSIKRHLLLVFSKLRLFPKKGKEKLSLNKFFLENHPPVWMPPCTQQTEASTVNGCSFDNKRSWAQVSWRRIDLLVQLGILYRWQLFSYILWMSWHVFPWSLVLPCMLAKVVSASVSPQPKRMLIWKWNLRFF